MFASSFISTDSMSSAQFSCSVVSHVIYQTAKDETAKLRITCQPKLTDKADHQCLSPSDSAYSSHPALHNSHSRKKANRKFIKPQSHCPFFPSWPSVNALILIHTIPISTPEISQQLTLKAASYTSAVARKPKA